MREADTEAKVVLDDIDKEISFDEDCLRPITLNLAQRIEDLVANIEVDLDARIGGAPIK
tara:strand:+ start:224 stop:400 length:177 start_codon:yes stop_codon:yes gene_type:complete